ncbi:acyl carrier protein [Nocardia nepalensis]|uniref:acyl carrier protein n=1 Tax=Nocardia nepalensis TaxID=3375448 RepID=UPI003B6715BD
MPNLNVMPDVGAPTMKQTAHAITAESVRDRLVERIAVRLSTRARDVDVHQYFNDLGLKSADALVLASELESWLGVEVEAAAMWYYPTIAELSAYLAEEHAAAAAA